MTQGEYSSKCIGSFINLKDAEKGRPTDVARLYEVFTALSLQTGCTRTISDKYFRYMVSRLFSERDGFLKILSSFPILGLRVLGHDMPLRSQWKVPVKRNGLPKPFGWYFGRLTSLSRREPTPDNVLAVKRIITLLSIGKMLTITSGRGLKRARTSYPDRIVKSRNPERVSYYNELYGEKLDAFLKHVNFQPYREKLHTPGANPVEGEVFLDPSVYSLKSLAKKANRSYRQKIPNAVLNQLLRVNDINPMVKPSPDAIDGKLCIITESGGKYRGICPYYSPLVHSSTVYRTCRIALSGFIPDVSLDQKVGHLRARYLSTTAKTVVSADASNFTDSLDIDFLDFVLTRIGEKGFLDYLSSLRISSYRGVISTPLPLMGLKGCYELGCLCICFSLWMKSIQGGLSLESMASANDDLCCLGIPSAVEEAYNLIGASLNPVKTVISNTVTIFCGKMYWKGQDISPVRFNITQSLNGGPGEVICNSSRDFLDNAVPTWGRYALLTAYGLIKKSVIKAVGASRANFDLPSKLGGFRLPGRGSLSLNKLLMKRSVLRYALYNCPFVEEIKDPQTQLIAYIRLGKEAVLPDGRVMASVTLPSTAKATWIRRKKLVDTYLATGRLSELDVYEYYYSDTSIAV